MSAKCKSCQAEILWATTRKGKLMPLDALPVGGATAASPGVFVLGKFDMKGAGRRSTDGQGWRLAPPAPSISSAWGFTAASRDAKGQVISTAPCQAA